MRGGVSAAAIDGFDYARNTAPVNGEAPRLQGYQSVAGARQGGRRTASVAVVLGLEGAGGGDADVGGLLGAELGELDADAGEVQARDLLVEVLRQGVDLVLVLVAAGPELDLGEGLVGEARPTSRRTGGRWRCRG